MLVLLLHTAKLAFIKNSVSNIACQLLGKMNDQTDKIRQTKALSLKDTLRYVMKHYFMCH